MKCSKKSTNHVAKRFFSIFILKKFFRKHLNEIVYYFFVILAHAIKCNKYCSIYLGILNLIWYIPELFKALACRKDKGNFFASNFDIIDQFIQ